MKIEVDNDTSKNMIQSYDSVGIKINNEVLTSSFILSASRLIKHWPVTQIQTLQSTDLNVICEQAPEVILLGSGKQLVFPSGEILTSIYKKNIGVEVMDTFAACRSYNILLSEGRNVLAALIL